MSVVLQSVVDLQKDSYETLRKSIFEMIRVARGAADCGSSWKNSLIESSRGLEREIDRFDYARSLLKTAALLKEEFTVGLHPDITAINRFDP